MTQPNQHRYYRCQRSLSAYHVRPDGTMASYTIYPGSGTAEMQFYTSDSLLDALQEINAPAIAITSDEFTAHKWRVIEFMRAKEVMP